MVTYSVYTEFFLFWDDCFAIITLASRALSHKLEKLLEYYFSEILTLLLVSLFLVFFWFLFILMDHSMKWFYVEQQLILTVSENPERTGK